MPEADLRWLDAVLDALRVRDERRSTLRTKLESLNESATTVPLDESIIEARVRERLAEWRGLLGRHVAWTRELLQKLLVGKMTLTPIVLESGERVYELAAEFTLARLFSGILTATGGTSPRGCG